MAKAANPLVTPIDVRSTLPKKSYWFRSVIAFLALIVTVGLSLIPALISYHHKIKDRRRAILDLKPTEKISTHDLMDEAPIITKQLGCFFSDFYLTMGARGLPVYNSMTEREQKEFRAKVKVTP